MRNSDADSLAAWMAAELGVGAYRNLSVAVCADDLQFSEYSEGVGPDSLFDLASLTKPLVATAALWLEARGSLDLSAEVFGTGATLESCLRHTGGAAPWFPLYALNLEALEALASQLSQPRWWREPRPVYSDLGMIAASLWISQVIGCELGQVIHACLDDLIPDFGRSFLWCNQRGDWSDAVAPSDLSTAKEVELAQQLGVQIEELGPPEGPLPQDGNARFLLQQFGIVGGHAGGFATLDALVEFGRWWLRSSRTSTGTPYARALQPVQGRLLGWFDAQTSSLPLPAKCFGHTGFVGGGLWVFPVEGVVLAVLGERTDPCGDLAASRRRLVKLVSGRP